MNTVNDLPIPGELRTELAYCPWGIAAVGGDGNVCAINPAFTRFTGLATADVLGMGEADFVARLDSSGIERQRVETAGDLRAIHYFRESSVHTEHDQRMSGLAEALREPLASIYGFTELLLTQDYDDETRRDLTATLLDQTEVMSNIINEKLDTRKIEPAAPPQTSPR
jgi:PAS domain S-box-containing protein